MSPVKVSLARLRLHEAYTTMRLLFPHGSNWVGAYESVARNKARALRQLVKSWSLMLFLFLLMNSLREGSNISLTIGDITASIPLPYILAISAVIYFLSFIAFIQYWLLNSLQSQYAQQVKIHGFNHVLYPALTRDEEDLSLGLPPGLNLFLKERYPFSKIAETIVAIVFCVLVVPLVAFSFFLIGTSIDLTLNHTLSFVEGLSVLLAVAVVVLIPLYLCIYFVPMPHEKNTEWIRWIFLYDKYSRWHPQVEKWVQNDGVFRKVR